MTLWESSNAAGFDSALKSDQVRKESFDQTTTSFSLMIIRIYLENKIIEIFNYNMIAVKLSFRHDR